MKRKSSDSAMSQDLATADTQRNEEPSEPTFSQRVKRWLGHALSYLMLFLFVGGFFIDRYRKTAVATDLVHSLCQGKEMAGPELTPHMTQRNYAEFVDYPWPCDTKVRLKRMKPPYEPSYADAITMVVLEPAEGSHIAYLEFEGLFAFQKLRLKKIWIKENRNEPFP